MYNPYSLDLASLRRREMIADADRRRTAKASRRARRQGRALSDRPTGADMGGRQPTARPALPLRA